MHTLYITPDTRAPCLSRFSYSGPETSPGKDEEGNALPGVEDLVTERLPGRSQGLLSIQYGQQL